MVDLFVEKKNYFEIISCISILPVAQLPPLFVFPYYIFKEVTDTIEDFNKKDLRVKETHNVHD